MTTSASGVGLPACADNSLETGAINQPLSLTANPGRAAFVGEGTVTFDTQADVGYLVRKDDPAQTVTGGISGMFSGIVTVKYTYTPHP